MEERREPKPPIRLGNRDIEAVVTSDGETLRETTWTSEPCGCGRRHDVGIVRDEIRGGLPRLSADRTWPPPAVGYQAMVIPCPRGVGRFGMRLHVLQEEGWTIQSVRVGDRTWAAADVRGRAGDGGVVTMSETELSVQELGHRLGPTLSQRCEDRGRACTNPGCHAWIEWSIMGTVGGPALTRRCPYPGREAGGAMATPG